MLYFTLTRTSEFFISDLHNNSSPTYVLRIAVTITEATTSNTQKGANILHIVLVTITKIFNS